MKKIKSNPVVYPFLDFKNLSNKKINDPKKFKKESINFKEIKEILNRIKTPTIKLNEKNSLEEKILSLFLNKNFLFGPKKYITDLKTYWIEKIRKFTKKNQPIKFTLLGFPFKAPLILKTPRKLPDMGDVIVLKNLFDLCSFIKRIYKPGAVIYIFTEGCFGSFTGVDKKTIEKYEFFLNFLIKKLNYQSNLKTIKLGEIEKEKNFQNDYKKEIVELTKKFKNKDREFMEKYKKAYSSIYHIINPKTKNIDTLIDLYNKKLKKPGEKIIKLRKTLEKKTNLAIINYFAYLNIRDKYNFLEKKVPNGLALTVSPKPYRLGIISINNKTNKLPHHGVCVYYSKKNFFTIEYYIDLLRMNKKITAIYLTEDLEKLPFYYSINE